MNIEMNKDGFVYYVILFKFSNEL